MLEVGCGYGCSLFPLLYAFPAISTYFATDFCPEALRILQENERYVPARVVTHQWDVTTSAPATLIESSPSAVLAIFALSAVHPSLHELCFENIANVLTQDGHLLFRDYGITDATMYRHAVCYEDCLLERSDGTLAYYFSLEYVAALLRKTARFRVVELSYATVITRNRKTRLRMKRVFVHGVFQKI